MSKKIFITSFCLCSIILFSCKTRSLESKTETPKVELSKTDALRINAISKIEEANFDFNYLSAKAKVKVNREGKDFNLTFNIRMQKNEKIWISVNAIASIEVARIMLTKDSVKVIDRINKQYLVKDYAFLSEVLKSEVDFFTIQNMMIGNAPNDLNYKRADFTELPNFYEFSGKEKGRQFIVHLRKEDVKLHSLNFTEGSNEKRSISVDYSGFKLVENANFPFLINSKASSQKESVSLNVEYQKVEKVVNLDFPFNIPKRFE